MLLHGDRHGRGSGKFRDREISGMLGIRHMDTAFKGFCHSFYRVLSSFADKSADYNLYYSITNVRIIQAFSRKIWFFICFGVPPDRDMLSVKRKVPEREWVYSFCFCKKNQKAAARTCKKLPVASFCASETAETGRIANGCEQGDHVSRSRQALRPRFKSPVDTVFWIG